MPCRGIRVDEIFPRRPVEQSGGDLVRPASLLGGGGGPDALERGTQRGALRPVAFVAGAPPARRPFFGLDSRDRWAPPGRGEIKGKCRGGKARPRLTAAPPLVVFSGHRTPA